MTQALAEQPLLPLTHHQFEVDGVVFGLGTDVEVDQGGFKPDAGNWRTQDFAYPLRDGGVPGRDFKEIATWQFQLFTNMDDEVGALEAARVLGTVWPRPELVAQPLLLTPLRYAIGDRVRRVYGRPRRWTAPPDNLLLGGLLKITADFAVFDPLFYDDVEQNIEIDLYSGTTGGGGLRAPLTAPMRTTGVSTPKSRAITVAGDRNTWPIIEFSGGVNPWVEINGWRCQSLRTLNWDEKHVVDTRPWVRSSTLNGSYARLARGVALEDMKLSPGRHSIRFGNDSELANAKVTVRWRDAHSSL